MKTCVRHSAPNAAKPVALVVGVVTPTGVMTMITMDHGIVMIATRDKIAALPVVAVAALVVVVAALVVGVALQMTPEILGHRVLMTITTIDTRDVVMVAMARGMLLCRSHIRCLLIS